MNEDEIMTYINKGVEIGKQHQTPSPPTLDRFDDVIKVQDELEAEVSEFRRSFVRVLLGGLVVVASYGVWVGTIQTTINNHAKEIEHNEKELSEISKKQQSSDITMAEIKTKLVGIEAGIADLKRAMKIQ